MSVELLLRGAAYGLLLLLAAVLAVWGAFLVPLRVGSAPVPVGLLLACAVAPLCLAGGRLLGSRSGVAGPWLVWAATALLLSSQRREGDLVITSSLRGLAFLALGFLGGAAAVGFWSPPGPSRRVRTTRFKPGSEPADAHLVDRSGD